MSTITTKDVIDIDNCGLYAKSPEALQALFVELADLGYDIEDCSEESDHRPDRATQEKNGWYLWYASLRDDVLQRVGKCGSCGSYISSRGIACHGHRCEVCGAVTALEYINGEPIHFRLNEDTRGDDFTYRDLCMRIFDYDMKTDTMLVYPTPMQSRKYFSQQLKETQETLAANKGTAFTERLLKCPPKAIRKKLRALKAAGRHAEASRIFNRRGQKVLAFPKILHGAGTINISDVGRGYRNYACVKLYQGVEYSEFMSELPIKESYSIYEAWHWAPLPKSTPMLHEKIIHAAGMVSRIDYYCQDGSTAFYAIHMDRMRLFVEHFTDIPIAEWDAFAKICPKSGPGFIRALAAFCQGKPFKEAEVTIKSNAFGTIGIFMDALAGKPVSEGAIACINATMEDRETVSLLTELLTK